MRKYSFLLVALLFFIGGVTAVFGQGRSISGKVLDSESGTPIVGASVEVVDAQTGTSTDENGNFTVTMPEGHTKLKIKNTSYKTQIVVKHRRRHQTLPAPHRQKHLPAQMEPRLLRLHHELHRRPGRPTTTTKIHRAVPRTRHPLRHLPTLLRLHQHQRQTLRL